MKRTATAIGVALAIVWSHGVFAQGRNFAGSWTLDSEKTAAANQAAGGTMVAAGGRGGGGARGGGGVAVAGGGGGAVGAVAAVGGVARSGGGGGRGGPAGPMTIAMDASSFTVTNGTTVTPYRLDGKATNIETPRGTTTAKVAWQGDKLVIEAVAPGMNGGDSITTITSWYLEGESLVRETSTAGVDAPARKTYYKK